MFQLRVCLYSQGPRVARLQPNMIHSHQPWSATVTVPCICLAEKAGCALYSETVASVLHNSNSNTTVTVLLLMLLNTLQHCRHMRSPRHAYTYTHPGAGPARLWPWAPIQVLILDWTDCKLSCGRLLLQKACREIFVL